MFLCLKQKDYVFMFLCQNKQDYVFMPKNLKIMSNKFNLCMRS